MICKKYPREKDTPVSELFLSTLSLAIIPSLDEVRSYYPCRPYIVLRGCRDAGMAQW